MLSYLYFKLCSFVSLNRGVRHNTIFKVIFVTFYFSLIFFCFNIAARAGADELTTVYYFDAPGPVPAGLAFDGVCLWNVDTEQEKIYQLETWGEIISVFDSPGSNPGGLTFDGTYLWNADPAEEKIYKLNLSGDVIGAFDSPGPRPWGLVFDGVYLWNADFDKDKIYKMDTSGKVADVINSPGTGPGDLAFDGVYLWNTDSRGKIYKLNLNGDVIAWFDPPGLNPSSGLTFDGTFLWNADYETGKIYKLAETGQMASPVYRFYSKLSLTHFFTLDEVEKNNIINNMAEIYNYEGIAWYAHRQESRPPDASPVYRFYAQHTQTHFFTIDETEKNTIIADMPETYQYEGVAWYSYQPGQQPSDAFPVYRFYSKLTDTHLYTIDQNEKNYIIDKMWEVYQYEGVAWYSYLPAAESEIPLTLTVPDGGESWARGSTYTIRWTHNGLAGDYVRIYLYKYGELNRTITSKTANDGTYLWKISSFQGTGDDYKIQVRSYNDASIADFSDDFFSIQAGN